MAITKHLPKIIVATGILSVVYAFISVGKGKNALNNYGKYLPEDGSDIFPIDAKNIATTIHEIMRVTNWSNTDKNKIVFEALQPLSTAQFAQVIKSFGLKYYNPRIGDDLTYFGFKPTKYSLPFWLKSELNNNEYSTLKTRFSKYLK